MHYFMDYYLCNKTLIFSQVIAFEGILYVISFYKIQSWALQMDSDTNSLAPCKKKKKDQLLRSGISNRVPASINNLTGFLLQQTSYKIMNKKLLQISNNVYQHLYLI